MKSDAKTRGSKKHNDARLRRSRRRIGKKKRTLAQRRNSRQLRNVRHSTKRAGGLPMTGSFYTAFDTAQNKLMRVESKSLCQLASNLVSPLTQSIESEEVRDLNLEQQTNVMLGMGIIALIIKWTFKATAFPANRYRDNHLINVLFEIFENIRIFLLPYGLHEIVRSKIQQSLVEMREENKERNEANEKFVERVERTLDKINENENEEDENNINIFAFYGALKINDVNVQNEDDRDYLRELQKKEYRFYGLQSPDDEFHEPPRPAGNRNSGLFRILRRS